MKKLAKFQNREHMLWIGPAAIILLILVAYPTVYAIKTSFFEWNLTRPALGSNFVGIKNFLDLFQDETFRVSILNTVVIVILSVGAELILGIFLAMVMNQKLPGIRLARALLIAPTMIAPVVAGLIWRYMYFPGYGIIPNILSFLGFNVENGILGSHDLAIYGVIITDVWQWTPFVILVTLAGLQGLPDEPYEAARIDGAKTLQLLRYITLPMLKPVLLIILLLRLMDTVKTFDTIYAMTKGGPGNSTLSVTYYGYKQGIEFFNMGYGAAIALVILILVLILSQFLIRVVFKDD